MIIKEKVVHFYKWQTEDATYQVIGLQGTKGGGIKFSIYIDKQEINDENGQLMQKFAKELTSTKK